MTSDVSRAAASAADRARHGTLVERLARIGLAAKGASYVLVGALAIGVAVADHGEPTSREGAVAAVADEPGGAILLGALAVGFAAYAVWRLVQAVFDRDDEGTDAAGLAKRTGYAGQAVLYAVLVYVTVDLLFENRGLPSQTRQARQATAELLGLRFGEWLVGLVGACLVGAGLYNGYRALARKFDDKWERSEMSPVERRWAFRIGVAGLLARFVVFSLIGAFLVRAALEYDPREAIGLDGALRKLAAASYGPWLLGIVSAGLVCYGLLCLVEARYRRI